MGRLVINGEEVYELDEDCLKEKYSSKVQAAFERQERGRVCPPGKHMGIQETKVLRRVDAGGLWLDIAACTCK